MVFNTLAPVFRLTPNGFSALQEDDDSVCWLAGLSPHEAKPSVWNLFSRKKLFKTSRVRGGKSSGSMCNVYERSGLTSTKLE